MKVGDTVLYCKVANDFTTEELVNILHIDEQSKSATIYIPSLNRERDTYLTRLYEKKTNNVSCQTESLSMSLGIINYELPKHMSMIIDFEDNDVDTLKSLICNENAITEMGDISDNTCVHGIEPPLITSYGLLNGIQDLYGEIKTINKSIDIIHKNQLILDKKINFIIDQHIPKTIYELIENMTSAIQESYGEDIKSLKEIVQKQNIEIMNLKIKYDEDKK